MDSQHFKMELECNPPHVMWAGMTPTCVIGFFCGGAVNASFYVEMSEVHLIPQLRSRALMEAVCLLA
jgi:hypothetical protein